MRGLMNIDLTSLQVKSKVFWKEINRMRRIDVVLLPLAAALVIVGAHMTITQGIVASYPIFMMAVTLLFWYKFRKAKQAEVGGTQTGSGREKKKKKAK